MVTGAWLAPCTKPDYQRATNLDNTGTLNNIFFVLALSTLGSWDIPVKEYLILGEHVWFCLSVCPVCPVCPVPLDGGFSAVACTHFQMSKWKSSVPQLWTNDA